MANAPPSTDTIPQSYVIIAQNLSEQDVHTLNKLLVDTVLELSTEMEQERGGQLMKEIRVEARTVSHQSYFFCGRNSCCQSLGLERKLIDGSHKQITFASVCADASELLVSTMVSQRARMSAVLNEQWEQLALTTTNGIDFIIDSLHAILTNIEIHWQASHHIQAIRAVRYPWISWIMFFLYHLALTAWAGLLLIEVFQYCARSSRELSLASVTVARHCSDLVIAYLLAGGSRLALLAAILVWLVLEWVGRIW